MAAQTGPDLAEWTVKAGWRSDRPGATGLPSQAGVLPVCPSRTTKMYAPGEERPAVSGRCNGLGLVQRPESRLPPEAPGLHR